jgi:hypothetical protein
VLERKNTLAQVIETKTKKDGIKIIDIKICGFPNYRMEMLTIIREEIRKIQSISFPNLPFYEMVPCKCNECKNNSDTEFYDYEVLENLLIKKNIYEKQCPQSGEMVNITNMIDAVYPDGFKITREKEVDLNKYNNTYMKIDNLNINGKQIVFSDKIIGDVTYTQNSNFTNEELTQLLDALKDLKIEEQKEIVNDLKELHSLNDENEKISFYNKFKIKLKSFGIGVAEHMSAIGAVKALEYIYIHLDKIVNI